MLEEWEILEALLMAQGEFHEQDLSDEALFRFAAGWCSVDEEDEALQKLVRSEASRKRLIEIRARIEQRTQQPVGEFSPDSIDQSFRHLLGEALAAVQAPRILANEASGRNILRGLGRSLSDRGLLPAAVRSSNRTQFSVGPDGPSGTLSIERQAIGLNYLVVRAGPGAGLGVRPLVLILDDGTSSTVVREFFPFGQEVRIELGELGLDPASVHPGMFRITHEVEDPHWADTIRAESFLSPGRKLRIRLASPPRIEAGRLLFEPIIPKAIVEEAADGVVELRMLLGTTSVLLGTQKVPSNETSIRIETKTPGVADGKLVCCEVFSFCFRSAR